MTKMTTNAIKGRPVGHVHCWMQDGAANTIDLVDACNTTTYSASDALALAYAGDSSYMPSKIAFVYGSAGDLSIDSVSKTSTWQDIRNMCESNPELGYSITGFSYSPSVSSSDESKYENNVVTFHCRTNDSIPAGSFVYMACLLGKGTNGSDYNLLAAISLESNGAFRAKPESFELSIDWSVKFN